MEVLAFHKKLCLPLNISDIAQTSRYFRMMVLQNVFGWLLPIRFKRQVASKYFSKISFLKFCDRPSTNLFVKE